MTNWLNNTSIQRMCISLTLTDYIQGVGLYAIMDELEKSGELDTIPEQIFFYKLGYLSQQMSRKLSHFGRDKIRDIYRDTRRDILRDKERDRKRDYRERKKTAPLPPTPPITPAKKERENDIPPVLLRNTAPQGASEREKPAKKPDEIPEDFLRFYSGYPRKVNRPQALRAWRSLNPDADTVDRIVADVERRLKTEWRGSEMRFIPHPATYLNGRRWEDETEVTERASNPEPADEDLFRGMSDEDIAILERLAADGEHWG